MTDVDGKQIGKGCIISIVPPFAFRFEEPMNFPFPEEFEEFSH